MSTTPSIDAPRNKTTLVRNSTNPAKNLRLLQELL